MTDEDRQILAASALPPAGRIRAADRLGISPTRLHQRLNQLIDSREALEHNPTLVNRLRRVREARRRARGGL
ncbi:DUF3263 domain-containing protein [Desertihabitans brevis]|uniref:DUF3263 domain-containing protein n=1 Tax=Desertihabitans brevis TaxID=2268447 RepID=A0A367YRF6_9ACTN|nr:DUF3263 domain-containing protein [Desertihabitans brevis]RCK68317.1 DUF3263 domain-containing protein [Desertihabitans brevis]